MKNNEILGIFKIYFKKSSRICKFSSEICRLSSGDTLVRDRSETMRTNQKSRQSLGFEAWYHLFLKNRNETMLGGCCFQKKRRFYSEYNRNAAFSIKIVSYNFFQTICEQ